MSRISGQTLSTITRETVHLPAWTLLSKVFTSPLFPERCTTCVCFTFRRQYRSFTGDGNCPLLGTWAWSAMGTWLFHEWLILSVPMIAWSIMRIECSGRVGASKADLRSSSTEYDDCCWLVHACTIQQQAFCNHSLRKPELAFIANDAKPYTDFTIDFCYRTIFYAGCSAWHKQTFEFTIP